MIDRTGPFPANGRGSAPAPGADAARVARSGRGPGWPVVARVALVRTFPLKSGAGASPDRVAVDAGGVVGDRAWAVVDAGGVLLRPRHHPGLARLSLAPAAAPVPGAAPVPEDATDGAGEAPRVLVDGREPDGGSDLATLLGVPGARLVPLDGPGDPGAERAALHLVGERAADDPDAPTGAEPGRRANLVLAGLPPGAERAWVGTTVRVGGALLEVTATPRHCLGVYARVLVPGELGVGDPVAPRPPDDGAADQ